MNNRSFWLGSVSAMIAYPIAGILDALSSGRIVGTEMAFYLAILLVEVTAVVVLIAYKPTRNKNHYDRDGVTGWEVMDFLYGDEAVEYFNRLNVVKYMFRAQLKHDEPYADWKKAKTYAEHVKSGGGALDPLEELCLNEDFEEAEKLMDAYVKEVKYAKILDGADTSK